MEMRWGLSAFRVAELRSGSIVKCIPPHHFPFEALDPGGGQLPAFEDAPSFTNWVRSEVGARKIQIIRSGKEANVFNMCVYLHGVHIWFFCANFIQDVDSLPLIRLISSMLQIYGESSRWSGETSQPPAQLGLTGPSMS